MKTQEHSQTKVLAELFRLPVFKISPYFYTGRGAITEINMAVTRAVAVTYLPFSHNIAVNTQFYDNSGTWLDEYNLALDTTTYTSPAAIYAEAVSQILGYATSMGYTNIASASDIIWPVQGIMAASGPNSYQTIVTQTGTTAPAVSGSLVPTSTYPAGTTFTWARTGVGVYTLTASTAVFNTSGKTGVFVGALNNLNASYKTVVTSSTVITITTAIGSLLGLGLLGLTATNTDALLSNTMIYVQTYA